MPDGVHLGLLRPCHGEADTDLWFQATATEVYPWWPGQRWLEWILLGIIATCVVLLVLLHLGRRWSTLDLVAQCLLLSLLLLQRSLLLLRGSLLLPDLLLLRALLLSDLLLRGALLLALLL